jgi:hypothetical protein
MFYQMLYSALPHNILKFQHFKQIMSRKYDIFKDNLILGKPKKVLQYQSNTSIFLH